MELNDIFILLDRIDTDLSKENPEYDAFKTDFGKEFESNYYDCITFTKIVSMFPIMLQYIINAKKTVTPEDFFNFLDTQLKEAEKINGVNQIQKEKIVRVRKLIEELQTIFLDPDYFSDIPLLTESSEEEINSDKDEVELTNSFLVEELRLMERVYSYFVLTLYTYIDSYSMALFQYVVSELPTSEVFDIIKSTKVELNPKERIKSLMKNLKFEDNGNLRKRLKKVLREKAWENHQDEFRQFIKIRNYIAHRDPITAKKTLAKKFPKSAEDALIKANELRKNMNFEEIKDDFILTMIKPILESDFESFFLLQFIGESCYKYLALIDILVYHFFNSEIVDTDQV